MPHPATVRPTAGQYASEFGKYISLVPDGDVRQLLAEQAGDLLRLLGRVCESGSLVRHAPYTWSVKQVLGHITDCERVFGHRAHWIARGGAAPLVTFDEQAFMEVAAFDRWPFVELVDEFQCVRRAHMLLFEHLEPGGWLRTGVVNDHPATAAAA
ncbi:MAG: DinB family protein [Pirellulales bacterium]|nr:DinB family protein [Pirellulales bacterium]